MRRKEKKTKRRRKKPRVLVTALIIKQYKKILGKHCGEIDGLCNELDKGNWTKREKGEKKRVREMEE